jgi:TPR repeat protein
MRAGEVESAGPTMGALNGDEELVDRALEAFAQKKHADAAALLIPLAERGNARAQCNLALLSYTGLGAKQDSAHAIELYLLVGEMNIREGFLSATAYHNLATLFMTGAPDLAPNPARAREYARKSEGLGFPMPFPDHST